MAVLVVAALARLDRRRRRRALALSSGTFLFALNYTTVANVLFLMATAPVFAALLGWAVSGERIPPRTWLAMALAAGGVSAMVAGTLEAGFLAVAFPLVMTRRSRS